MKKFLVRSLAFLVSLGLIGFLFVVGVIFYFSMSLPQISTLADYQPPIPSRILSKDGEVLLEVGRERRDVVEFEDIPQRVVDAFIAAEDDRFFEHDGVDFTGIFRAFIANLKAGRAVQGGSTITQQVAISFLLTRDKLVQRKIQDILLAIRIEKEFSKEEILYLYLNQVYFGGGYYGVKAASRGYFDKDLEDVTIAEAAMVAGLLVAPGRYSPYINPLFAQRRQSYVLRRMWETDKITEQEYLDAVSEQIKFRPRRSMGMKGGHFTDWIRQRVIREIGEEEFLTGGYEVKTTLNWPLQQKAEQEVINGLKEIDKRQGFAGPIEQIEYKAEVLDEWMIEQRRDLLRRASSYFVLDENLNRQYELDFDEQQWVDLNERQREWSEEVNDDRFFLGNSEDDPLLDVLEVSEMYPAVVLHADNSQRVIYVSIGGVRGIIPFNYFRWAHEREITRERRNWTWVTRPTDIVSPGDVVWTRVIRKNSGLWRHIHNPYRERLAEIPDSEKLRKIQAQRYLLLFLDQIPEVEGALLSIHPRSGEIVSFVGGMDFRRSQFSRATQAKRQSGSAFKPLVYAAALEEGYNPSSIVMDTPEALAGVDEGLNWKPRNYDNQFKGPITFRNALEQSRNVPTIKIAEDIGVRKIQEFTERIGFNAELPPDLTLSLGTFGATLLDLVTTFGIFPNSGRLVTPKSIIEVRDRNGHRIAFEESIKASEEVIEDDEEVVLDESVASETPEEVWPDQENLIEDILAEKEPEPVNPFLENLDDVQVYDERLAYIMTNLLRGVVLHGTGRGAKSVSSFFGGKTGTTNNFVDAWFIGFSSQLVTGVWTGFDDNRPMGFAETGARAALPIWSGFMAEGLKVFGENDFRAPQGIVNVMVDKNTGELARASTTNAFREAFVAGSEPGSIPERPDDFSVDDDFFEDDDLFMSP